MKTDLAENNLQVIRTLMERSAIYRRALAPMMLWAGIMAAIAAVVGWAWHGMERHMSDREFILFWLVAGLVVFVGAVFLVRRQAIRDREPFWSPPLRRVTQAILPAVVASVAWTLAVFPEDVGETSVTKDHCVVVWIVLYGCALQAAGMFAPRTLRRAGWLFIAAGLAIGFFGKHVNSSPHVWMGLVFGGLHLAGAVYLFASERKT